MLSNPLVLKTLQQVAKSIASILNVDIMILDDKLQKVGGTITSDRRYNISNIYHHIMNTGEVVFVDNPGSDELCKNCKLYGNCPEKIEYDFPIKVYDKTIGLISVVGYTVEHREMIRQRRHAYYSFISTMSEMIATKVLEVQATEKMNRLVLQMEQIFNSVSEGLVSTDKEGYINYCSAKVESFFSLKANLMLGRNIYDFFSDLGKVWKKGTAITEFSNVELTITDSAGIEKLCYVSSHPILDEDRNIIGIIFKLFDTREVKNMIHNLLGFDQHTLNFSNIIGISKSLSEVKIRAETVAKSTSTVMIVGESGTGKELFARAIHNSSLVATGPFVAINCAAIPEALLESELFGYEAGAFTGAKREGKPGKFELADGGTLFLDEIGDMPLYLQAKILRVLEDKTIQRIGSVKEKRVSVRIISATNKDLENLVKENRFREDLFYRLNVIPIKIPPLRDRKEDLRPLVEYFTEYYNTTFGKSIRKIDPQVHDLFYRYSWPGNVRELENILEYSMMMEKTETLTLNSLPRNLFEDIENSNLINKSLKEQVAEFERNIILNKIAQFGNDQEAKNKAAANLEIGIATLYRKLQKY